MPKHVVNWVSDHTQICDRLDERVTHLASKNRIRPRTCYAILHEIEQRGDFQVTWGFADDGYSDTVRISRTKPKR